MFHQHLRHDPDPDLSRDHVRDRAQLASGQRDLWMETTRLKEVMNLLRKTMHFVQEQESLRFKIVQRNHGLLGKGVPFRDKGEQRFTADELYSQSGASLTSGCQCDIQFSGFYPSADDCGHV